MSFRENYPYHVMNNSSGRLVHSVHTRPEAEKKAKEYAHNSGFSHSVLKTEFTFYPVKTVESCKGIVQSHTTGGCTTVKSHVIIQ